MGYADGFSHNASLRARGRECRLNFNRMLQRRYGVADHVKRLEAGVTSTTKLTVAFELPGDIGGDAISHFKIEWDRVSNFQSRHSLPHKGETEISAVTERSYTISPPGGLYENVVYYVRVSARNRVGYGAVQWAEPPFATPIYQIPGMVSSLSAAPRSRMRRRACRWCLAPMARRLPPLCLALTALR